MLGCAQPVGGGSSSGRTPGSGPGSGGSNPPPPASAGRRAGAVAHSSRGRGRRPLTAETRVRIPYALLLAPLKSGAHSFSSAELARRRLPREPEQARFCRPEGPTGSRWALTVRPDGRGRPDPAASSRADTCDLPARGADRLSVGAHISPKRVIRKTCRFADDKHAAAESPCDPSGRDRKGTRSRARDRRGTRSAHVIARGVVGHADPPPYITQSSQMGVSPTSRTTIRLVWPARLPVGPYARTTGIPLARPSESAAAARS
jgi:hypothetical protein